MELTAEQVEQLTQAMQNLADILGYIVIQKPTDDNPVSDKGAVATDSEGGE